MASNADQEQNLWLQHVLTSTGVAFYEWDLANNTLTWSRNTSDVLHINGHDISTVDGFTALIPDRLRTGLHEERIRQSRGDSRRYHMDYHLELPHGDVLNVSESGQQVHDDHGQVIQLVGMIQAGESAHSSDDSNPEIYRYPALFVQSLDTALDTATQRGDETGALIIVSIDNLAMIVSGYGHDKAEMILNDACAAIREEMGPQNQLYRIQRDQFAVICPDITKESLIELNRKLLNMLKRFGRERSNTPLHIVASTSCIAFAECEHESEQPLSATDIIDSGYINLRGNHDRIGYYPDGRRGESSEDSLQQMEMANYLHDAIFDDRLRLAYQPIINASNGEISHYECLLRLVGDDGSLTSAGALIPVAERMGLIDIIDQMVLEMVVEDLLRHPEVHLAFNISNLTTNDMDWLDTFIRVLEATPEIAPRLMVEITETAAQRDLKDAAYFVAAIQALGCRVALDDFGTGYTSFRQLKALSCDLIKIDGTFIRDLEANADNKFFVKTLLDFIHGFGLEAVAECVETGESAKILMDLGVHYMQGYYFGKPMNYRVWLDNGAYAADDTMKKML